MRCSRCGHDNDEAARYCSSCGAAMRSEADTTVSLEALEDRHLVEEELGDLLAQIDRSTGMLVERHGEEIGGTYVLDADTTTVGRHPDSAIFLDDVTVSRRHAVIRRVEGGYEVSDVGSLNGTYVEHERVETAPLHDLAELQIGRFILTFVLGRAGATRS